MLSFLFPLYYFKFHPHLRIKNKNLKSRRENIKGNALRPIMNLEMFSRNYSSKVNIYVFSDDSQKSLSSRTLFLS